MKSSLRFFLFALIPACALAAPPGVENVELAQSKAKADVPPVEAVGTLPLPSVPASVAKEAVAASRQSSASLSERENVLGEEVETNVELKVKPGTTEIIRIARAYLNEIVTPFEDPIVITANQVAFEKRGSSIFITTDEERPVGIHIRSSDVEDARSISLALVPARIPPKTITLRWPNGMAGASAPASMTKAKRWEESAPYEEALFNLAKTVAQGQIPEGYSLEQTADQLPCALPEIEFFTGQRLTGHHFSMFVLRATNRSSSTVELLGHAGCNVPGLALVAPWPAAYLEPGASTEVFVAVANDAYRAQPTEMLRPSLLTH
jgi:conjugal transfer pilus assembly protein TraK